MKKAFQFASLIALSLMIFSCEKELSVKKISNDQNEAIMSRSPAGNLSLDKTFTYTESSTIAPCTTGPFTCPFPIWTSYHSINIPELDGVNKPIIKVSAHVSNINTDWIQLNQTSSVSGLSFYPGAGSFSRSKADISTAIGAMSASDVILTFTVHITATWKANN